MTTDLDTLARSASADLHRRTEAVDTEAALAALHRSAGSGRNRMRRMVPSGRPLVLAAAAIVLLAALAFAVGTRGGDGGTDRLGTQTSLPIDPTTYGPLLGTLRGIDGTDLRAEVYGPELLTDGAEVAVVITGGRPGQHYGVNQCAVQDGTVNPPSDCTIGEGGFTLDAGGTGYATVPVWAVFDGAGSLVRNDCRTEHCELQVVPILDDSESELASGTQLAEQPDFDRARSDSPWIPVEFAPDVAVAPLPEITATFLESTSDGMRVRLEGRNLQPGTSALQVAGYAGPRTGALAAYPTTGYVDLTDVPVPADGVLSTEVVIPTTVREAGMFGDVGGNEPATVDCAAPAASCDIRLVSVTLGEEGAAVRPPIIPEPIRYPEVR